MGKRWWNISLLVALILVIIFSVYGFYHTMETEKREKIERAIAKLKDEQVLKIKGVISISTEGDWTILKFDRDSEGNRKIPQVLNEFEEKNRGIVIKTVTPIYDTASSLVWGVLIWHTKREGSEK